MLLDFSGDEIAEAVRLGDLNPGSYLDPAVVVVDGKLSSVWATEELGEVRATAHSDRRSYQGGFRQQRPGRCYHLVIDPGARNDFVTLADVCRWCGGDGIHPFTSARWRQVLTVNVPLTRHVALHSFIVALSRRLARPLTMHRWSCAAQGIDPLAIFGFQSEDVPCPRCLGHGASSWIDSGVAVEPLAVLQSRQGNGTAARDGVGGAAWPGWSGELTPVAQRQRR